VTVHRRALEAGWTVVAAAGPGREVLGERSVPATVPGVVHLDLLAAGLIPDPYLDGNESALAWIGRTDWTYRTTFRCEGAGDADRADRADHADHVDLVADGLDTVARVELDGVLVGTARNMHRTHRFDVTRLLQAGDHELTVAFRAPRDAAEEAEAELGPRPHVNPHPYNALRKNASSFGWDWGPDLATSGIWRSIALESWSTARLAGVRPLVDVRADGAGVLDVHADVESRGRGDLRLRVRVAGRTTTVRAGDVARLEVPDVDRWWPVGYGDQPRYDVVVELLDGETVLDGRSARVGFRTVALDTEPDEHGTSFALRVNGVRVLVRGFDWIPDDALLPAVDRSRYAQRLRQARDAGANLLRVWGGGIHETEDFYGLCDELGLLVWQDFLFACAAYAEEEPLAGEVRAEAAEAVTRLSAHPSLVLWCGGNECLWGHEDWGWKGPLAGRSWGYGYWTAELPALVARLDATRPYVPNSPYSPDPGAHPNDPSHGPVHIWDVWNERDYTGYLSYRPRFVSEFGFQGPPTWSTLTRAVHDDPLTPDSPGMLAHQKAEDGNGKLARGLAGHLPEPAAFADWHWATQLNQARALATGIEHFRASAPACTGVVVWQLNDCWPVTSWAVVDGDGRLKPAWYAVRRAFRDRLAVVRSAGDALELAALADSAESWQATLRVERTGFDGAVLAAVDVPLELEPRGTLAVPLPPAVAVPADPRAELIVVRDGGRAVAHHWFAEDVDAALPAPAADVTAERTADGYRVSVAARTLLKDLALLVDRLDPAAVVDDMLVTLLPGESATLHLRTDRELPVSAFTAPGVLRCANDLVRGS
jgi:beta-mannosidase